MLASLVGTPGAQGVSCLFCQVAEDGIKELGYDEYIPIPSGGAIEMSLMLSQTQGIFTGGWAGRVKPGADPRSVDAPGISGGASAWAAIEVAKKAPEGSASRRSEALSKQSVSYQGWKGPQTLFDPPIPAMWKRER